MIRSYKQVELAELEGVSRRTIARNNKKYIAISFENYQTRSHHKTGLKKEPYSVRYIKAEDIKNFLESNEIKTDDNH